MPYQTTEEAVAAGAEIFADAETAARAIKRSFRDLRDVFERVRDDGHIGALECQSLAGQADAMATQFEANVWALHSVLTHRAQELGIDLPQPRDGGGR